MELTINVRVDDKFTTALEYLAAALNCNHFDYAKALTGKVEAKGK